MRTCFRCGAKMEEGYRIKMQRTGLGIEITDSDTMFSKRIGIPKAAVCFSCGEVSLYIDLFAEEKESYARIEKQKPVTAGSGLQVISGRSGRE